MAGPINLLFDGLTYTRSGHFAHCSYFSLPPSGLGKILRISQNMRAYYMLKPSNKVYVRFKLDPWAIQAE